MLYNLNNFPDMQNENCDKLNMVVAGKLMVAVLKLFLVYYVLRATLVHGTYTEDV